MNFVYYKIYINKIYHKAIFEYDNNSSRLRLFFITTNYHLFILPSLIYF